MGFSEVSAPSEKDTGGTCRWMGCSSSRGPAGSFYCSSDYKCLCHDGYFSAGGQCTANGNAKCWAPGSTCHEVSSACSTYCDYTQSPDHYKQAIVKLVHEARELEDFPKSGA